MQDKIEEKGNEESQHKEEKQEDHSYARKEELTVTKEVSEEKVNQEEQTDLEEKCPKCYKNVKSKAVMCGNCKIWIHYYCLRTTKEQVELEYPGDYVCKECELKEVENKGKRTNATNLNGKQAGTDEIKDNEEVREENVDSKNIMK